MADEQKQQSQAPAGAPRREGSGGHGGGHGPGGGHGGPRREGGGPGGPGGPGGRPRGKRQYFRKKKVCKFCVEKMDFIDYKRADILSQFVQERGKILPRPSKPQPASAPAFVAPAFRSGLFAAKKISHEIRKAGSYGR